MKIFPFVGSHIAYQSKRQGKLNILYFVTNIHQYFHSWGYCSAKIVSQKGVMENRNWAKGNQRTTGHLSAGRIHQRMCMAEGKEVMEKGYFAQANQGSL